MDVVDAPVPLLLGLDIGEEQHFILDMKYRLLQFGGHLWNIQLKLINGHLFIVWNGKHASSILHTAYSSFSEGELRRMHLNFYHPSTQKLLNLIKRASQAHVDPNTRRVLDKISEACATCQTMRTKPLRFRVSIPPDKITFNNQISLDLMYLRDMGRKLPVLHVVDIDTGFSNAAFLPGQSTELIWNTFVRCWLTVYTGAPSHLRIDQGSVFTSNKWTQLSESLGISLIVSGVESQNSLGLGKRYHAPLRRVYNKRTIDHPSLDKDTRLRLAVKAINDTLGPEGLVPSLLVFGTILRLLPASSNHKDQQARFRALESARRKYTTIVAQIRILEALRSKTPPVSQFNIQPGSWVRVYRERSKVFEGPYKVVYVDMKQIHVRTRNGIQQFSITQCLPSELSCDSTIVKRFKAQLEHFKTDPDPTPRTPTSILVTDILHPKEDRCNLPNFDAARAKEFEALTQRNVSTIVTTQQAKTECQNHHETPKIIGSRWVLTIKNVETKTPTYKARIIAQGHRDREKSSIFHDSRSLRLQSIRFLTSIAIALGSRIWSRDITLAYLQARDKIQRRIYLRPPPEMNLSPNSLLRLNRTLYGLTEAGDYWHHTFANHILNDLHMKKCTSDHALFFKKNSDGILQGLMGTYVDDCLQTGTADFESLTDKTAEEFDSKPKDFNSFLYAGIYITTRAKVIELHQRPQIERLTQLDKDCCFLKFKSTLMKVNWITHTRPDVAFRSAQLAQVTEPLFGSSHVKLLNNTTAYLNRTQHLSIKHYGLDASTLYLRVYSDGSFANNLDLSSQLGYIILMCDASGRANIINYRSYKSKRVVRSILGAEIYAFADAFDVAFVLKHDLETCLDRSIRVCLLTDSKSIFDTITKASYTREKRLMIDLAAAREAYQREEISDIGHIKKTYNPADALTKVKPCKALESLLLRGRVDQPVEQWVNREGNSVFEAVIT